MSDEIKFKIKNIAYMINLWDSTGGSCPEHEGEILTNNLETLCETLFKKIHDSDLSNPQIVIFKDSKKYFGDSKEIQESRFSETHLLYREITKKEGETLYQNSKQEVVKIFTLAQMADILPMYKVK